MRLLSQTTRVAHFSLFLALLPVALVFCLIAGPSGGSGTIRIAEFGSGVLGWWWWIWAPTYLAAKGLFLANGVKKDKVAVRAALPWMIAINVALLFQIFAIPLLGWRFGK